MRNRSRPLDREAHSGTRAHSENTSILVSEVLTFMWQIGSVPLRPNTSPATPRRASGLPASTISACSSSCLRRGFFFSICLAHTHAPLRAHTRAHALAHTGTARRLGAGGMAAHAWSEAVCASRASMPRWSKAVRSATLGAARLSPRGGGCTPSGWASLWECRAAPQPPGAPSGGTWGRAGALPRRAL